MNKTFYKQKYRMMIRTDYEKLTRAQLFAIIRDFRNGLKDSPKIYGNPQKTLNKGFWQYLDMVQSYTYISTYDKLKKYNTLVKMQNTDLINIVIALDCLYCLSNEL